MRTPRAASRFQTMRRFGHRHSFTNCSDSMVRETSHKLAMGVAGALGIVAPIVFLYADSVAPAGWWPNWIMIIWPFSVVMIGIGGASRDFEVYTIIAALVLFNGLLYVFVGGLIYRLFRQRRSNPAP